MRSLSRRVMRRRSRSAFGYFPVWIEGSEETVLADWLMQRVKTLDRRPKASISGLTSLP